VWPFRLRLLLAFGAIYILWGTSYLAIILALRGIPPAFMSASRFILSGLILLAISRLAGTTVWPSPRAVPALCGIGVLLLVGNWGVVWSEQYIPSGVAALVWATSPLCIAGVTAAVSGAERLSARGAAGLVLGLVGVGILVWPKVSRGVFGDLRGEAVLVVAMVVWSIASVWTQHARLDLPPFVAAGWQMLAGGIVFFILALLLGEAAQLRWEGQSILAFVYLTICGSCLGYGSYIWLLHHVSAARAATFAYVNPLVAVFLGWLILGEPMGPSVLLGTLIIVPAVILAVSSPRHG
jgi:drug/metabolite transporter (DMT)-like permease